jgi:DNA-binding GntR family transcriptional regulator
VEILPGRTFSTHVKPNGHLSFWRIKELKPKTEIKLPVNAVPFVSKSEYVYQNLREAILNGLLDPGTMLNQAEIAEKLRISRMPVRDALKMLAQEGLVRLVLHRGARVTHFSDRDIQEIYAIRKILEGYAVREAIPHINKAVISRLEKINRAIEQNSRKGKVDAMIKENEQFHLLLYEGCKNRKLLELLKNLWSSYPKRIFWQIHGRAEQVVHQHNEILAAVKAKDANRAQKLIQAHLLLAQEGLMQIDSLRHGKSEGD